MTIFAGLYSPEGWTGADRDLADAIREQISRADRDPRQTFFDGTLFVCKVDIGAYAEPAWQEDATLVATLAGRPLLGGANRQADLLALCGPPLAGPRADAPPPPALLTGAQGSYCALIYRRPARRLRLLTDPLGLRPFYVCDLGGRWLFGTSLRIFRGLPIDLALDLDGVAEAATLGYFLLDHTPYTTVRASPPGACWTLDRGGLARADYQEWRALEVPHPDPEQGARSLHAAIESALDAWLAGRQGPAPVVLSGSLNSRLVAAALQRRGVEVLGLCDAGADARARFCCETFARERGIPLARIPQAQAPAAPESLEHRLGRLWARGAAHPDLPRPRPVWTGKGACLGPGAAALDEADIEAARWGDPDRLALRYMERRGLALPARIVCDYAPLQDNLRANLIASLQAFAGLSQPRAFLLLLALQHQRRHLILQREDLDLHRVELQTPLASPGVARAVLALALEDMQGCAAYRRLIERYYPEVMASPWCSSPGRLPCPLPIPSEAPGRRRPARRDPRRLATLRSAWELVRHWELPPGVIDRRGLAITWALTRAGISNGLYSLEKAEVFSRWLQR